MLETAVRPMFMKMIEWFIGTKTNFSISFGKGGKFIGNNVLSTLMLLVFITRHKYAKLQKQGGMLAPKAGS
jgi:hypothetical protein